MPKPHCVTCLQTFISESGLRSHQTTVPLCRQQWDLRLQNFNTNLNLLPNPPEPNIDMQIDDQNNPTFICGSSNTSSDNLLELPVGNALVDIVPIEAEVPSGFFGLPVPIPEDDDYKQDAGDWQANAEDDVPMQSPSIRSHIDTDSGSEETYGHPEDLSPVGSESSEGEEPQDEGIATQDDDSLIQEVFPNAGKVHQNVRTTLATLFDERQELNDNLYYPFSSQTDWELAAWLHESGLPTEKIDGFLKLKYVSYQRPSFNSAKKLHTMIESLPDPGPRWLVESITPTLGIPLHPISLYYRDPLEAIRSLLCRPDLASSMTFAPRRVWIDEDKQTRVYSEIETGEWWWRNQIVLGAGSTIVPVLLGSDKTHLTVLAGDKHAWPLYLSIGNINSRIRNMPSKNAWLLIAYLPVVKFEANSTAGEARLYHQCLRHILRPLVKAGTDGVDIPDSKGDVRFCYPLVAGHFADYPEQRLANIAAEFNSPVTTASRKHLGDALPSAPRTREWIRAQVNIALATADESQTRDKFPEYHNIVKDLHLNDVYLPYWLDLPCYQPELCLSPDILHGLLRFWRDHILTWTTALVGKDELDRRLKAIQPIIGWRHFKTGIKHMNQWTGREDRELLRVIIAAVAGAPNIDSKVMRCLRSMHDFIYLCQLRSHTTITLGYLNKALKTFHATKRVFIDKKVRAGKKGVMYHFQIPKLAGLHHYGRHIPELGTSPQFSTEIVESLHRPMAKMAYKATNHKDYIAQMCRFLDRRERIRYFEEYVIQMAEQAQVDKLRHEMHFHSPGYQDLMIQMRKEFDGPDAFLAIKPRKKSYGTFLNKKPDQKAQSADIVMKQYLLPDLPVQMREFLETYYPDVVSQEVIESLRKTETTLDTWFKLRIRGFSVQDDDEPAATRTVEAYPSDTSSFLNGDTLPSGRCQCVLVLESLDAEAVGIQGYRVAQVRLLFSLRFSDKNNPLHGVPLAYVHWFSDPKKDKDIRMYRVTRAVKNKRPIGAVIPVDSISRFVQLIPYFGSNAMREPMMSFRNSMDICEFFYINPFADRETFLALC